MLNNCFIKIKKYINKEIIPVVDGLKTLYKTLVFGTKYITPVYSFGGKLPRLGYFLTLYALGLLYYPIKYLDILIMIYVSWFFLFYFITAATQKRCRAFNYSGTFFILLVVYCMFVNCATLYVDYDDMSYIWKKMTRYEVYAELTVATLFFVPNKQNADIKKTSWLLKKPYLFIAVCFAIAIGLTIASVCTNMVVQ